MKVSYIVSLEPGTAGCLGKVVAGSHLINAVHFQLAQRFGDSVRVQEVNLAEHSDKYQSLIDATAKKIFIKMLENGASDIYEVENLWLNEYADMLYTLFPEGKRCVQDLYQALNTLKERGVTVSVNTSPAKSIVPDSVFTIKD